MIEIYKTYLDKLDKIDPYSISKGIEFYEKFFANCADAKIRDEAFWVFQGFYGNAMVKARSYPAIKEYIDHLNNDQVSSSSITVHSPNYQTIGDVYVKDVAMAIEIQKMFNENGLHIYQDEGHYYLYIEPDFLLKQFKPYVLSATQEFLQQDAVNYREGFTNDMALTISWERLGERIIFWEKFLRKYPDFIKKDQIEHNFCLYCEVFLQGTSDNSNPFGFCLDDEVGRLMSDVQEAYEKYINNYYPEFSSAILLHKYYEILKQNNFMNNDKVKAFLHKDKDYIKDLQNNIADKNAKILDKISEEVIAELKTWTKEAHLDNLWEDIIDQVQIQHYLFWDSYEDIIDSVIEDKTDKLSVQDVEFLWEHSDKKDDWDEDRPPVKDEMLHDLNLIIRGMILGKASNEEE